MLQSPKGLILILMRHGEAEGGAHDIDRRLTENGQEQVRKVGKLLRAPHIQPDTILTSSVMRVQETYAELDLSHLPHISCGEDLYRASSVDDILLTISSHTPATAQRVLVIGHNPYIHETALYLGASNPNDYLWTISQGYSPATATVLEVAGNNWDRLSPANCEIIDVLKP